jgi:hypothetical protein
MNVLEPSDTDAPATQLQPESTGSVSIAIYALTTILSLLIGAPAIVRNANSLMSATDSDLANFFLKSAAYIVRGDPWHMYAVRAAPPNASYPNVDPPLSIFLLAPALRWASSLGYTHSLGTQVAFVSLPFLPLAPLLGGLVVTALRLARPATPAVLRFFAFAVIALGPLTWISFAIWGHLEQWVMLCLLVAGAIALQMRWVTLAGVLVGLAILAGTAALFPAAALVTLLLTTRRWRDAALVGGLAAFVVAVGMAPFMVVDRRDTIYTFVSWHGLEQIGGNSIWSLFTVDAIVRTLPHAVGIVVRRLDTLCIAALAVVVAALAGCRLHVSAYGAEVWAVLAMAALGLPMLAKVVWPYYYLQPFALLLIYEWATLPRYRAVPWRWPVVSLGFLILATTLAQYVGLHSAGVVDRVGAGILEFAIMLLALCATWQRLWAAR